LDILILDKCLISWGLWITQEDGFKDYDLEFWGSRGLWICGLWICGSWICGFWRYSWILRILQWICGTWCGYWIYGLYFQIMGISGRSVDERILKEQGEWCGSGVDFSGLQDWWSWIMRIWIFWGYAGLGRGIVDCGFWWFSLDWFLRI